MTLLEEPLRIYVFDAPEHDAEHYDSWLAAAPRKWRAVLPIDEALWEPPPDCGLVVTKRHYDEPVVATLLRVYANRRIPILILADGILEYRNTWLHSELVPGSLFQPVVGDKIACYGRSQARIIESWDNVGKCEVVGAPRFDHMLSRAPRARGAGEPFRLLVTTAKTPGFTADQTAAVKRSLGDLKAWLTAHERITIRGRESDLQPVWRLTGGLDAALGVSSPASGVASRSLADVLPEVDAVITTPSTVILEGMLQGLSVAVLDYTNSPMYLPTAWSISAPEHFDQVVPELVDPPAARMLFQTTALHDALECRSPAADRMVELTEAMIRIGECCRSKGEPLAFPRRILADSQAMHHSPEVLAYDAALYPGVGRRRFLRLRVANLERAVARQRTTIKELKTKLRAAKKGQRTGLAQRLRSTVGRWLQP